MQIRTGAFVEVCRRFVGVSQVSFSCEGGGSPGWAREVAAASRCGGTCEPVIRDAVERLRSVELRRIERQRVSAQTLWQVMHWAREPKCHC